jgi:hypothetical protein
MPKKKPHLPAPGIVQLRVRVEHWRKTRKAIKPMPEELWLEAVGVAREHGVFAVCREIGLNYNALKARLRRERPPVARPQSEFVELKLPVVASGGAPLRAVELELVRAGGDRMIMRLSVGETSEVVALARAFWSRER